MHITPDRVPTESLVERLEAYHDYSGAKIRHLKSGAVYRITSLFLRESDLSVWFTYTPLQAFTPLQWGRPIHELMDGDHFALV